MRAKILKKSANKLKELEKLLQENREEFKHCIVYCEDLEQTEQAELVFRKLHLSSYVVFNSIIENSERSLDIFKDKGSDFIISINCLDQGVDIPSCQSLILLTGTTNPRQYIQRRGRVLRNFKNKPHVYIFDIHAFPVEADPSYRQMIKSKLLEIWEFLDSSDTPEEKSKVIEIMSNYNITSAELEAEILSWK